MKNKKLQDPVEQLYNKCSTEGKKLQKKGYDENNDAMINVGSRMEQYCKRKKKEWQKSKSK